MSSRTATAEYHRLDVLINRTLLTSPTWSLATSVKIPVGLVNSKALGESLLLPNPCWWKASVCVFVETCLCPHFFFPGHGVLKSILTLLLLCSRHIKLLFCYQALRWHHIICTYISSTDRQLSVLFTYSISSLHFLNNVLEVQNFIILVE